MDMLGKILLPLFSTIAIEAGVACLLGYRKGQFQLALAAINIITNLSLNYLLIILGYLNIPVTFMFTVSLEALVAIVEWLILVYLFRGPRVRILILSFLANALSFSFGLLVLWR